jgi:Tfp pilus assembly protein PilF
MEGKTRKPWSAPGPPQPWTKERTMKKQNPTPQQERKLRFIEAGILFTVALAVTVFVGARLMGGGAEPEPAPVAVLATEAEPAAAAEATVVDSVVIAAAETEAEPEVAVDPEPAPEPEPVVVTYAMAEQAYFDREYAAAVGLFDRYTDEHPQNAWGFYMLGLSNWKAGDLEMADKAFTYAIELAPDHVKSLVNHGRVLVQMGSFEEAAGRVAAALEIEPGNTDAQRVMGRIRHNQDRLDEAAACYERLLMIDADDAWALNNLGLVRIQQDRCADALAPLAKAAGLAPGTAVFENNLGIALERTGHYGQAHDAFARALDADPAYGKAETSRTRVLALIQEPDLEELDLAYLAGSFEIRPEPVMEIPTDVAVVDEE